MRKRRPIILGIVGDSAAGKTTITRGLVTLLGPERVTHVCTDDYHKYDRRERSQHRITALHPDCNYLDIIELHLERLHFGQPILKPVYDHSTGTLVRPEYLAPREFVIVEGLLGFHTPIMRQFYDVMVYLDPLEALRREWKVKRDTAKRGYKAEEVMAELEVREPDSAAYIRPQRDFADIIVRFHPPATPTDGVTSPDLDIELVLRPTIPHPDLSYLLERSHDSAEPIRLELGRDGGRPVDFLKINGSVAAEHAAELEDAIWRHLPDLRRMDPEEFGEYQDRTQSQHSHQLALTQLLLTYHLLRRYRDVPSLPFARPVAALSILDSATPTDGASYQTVVPQ